MQRRTSPPPDRHPRPPRFAPPPGACDTHFHIYGPQQRFPLHEGRMLDVEDCTLDQALALHDALRLSRGLVVQSFQHGHSYEYMLHALAREPARFRGVAAPAPDIDDAELEILTRAGVVAARFAFRTSPRLDVKMVHRLHNFGWQAHFFVQGPEILDWRDHILAAPGKFVLEHMGWPPVHKGVESAEFRCVLDCLDTGRCWVKLSPRFSAQQRMPFADTLPFIHRLVAFAPERLLWGSDWPHPGTFGPMPNDGELLDLMLEWAPDEAIRNRILAENPADLFGFGPPTGPRAREQSRSAGAD